MHLFYILLASSIITSYLYIKLYINKRYIFLKPSIAFCIFFNVFFQWPFVICYDEISMLISYTLLDIIIIFSFTPILILIVSPLTFNNSAISIYNNIRHSMSFSIQFQCFLFAGTLIGAIIYLYYVPFRDTGLMSILRGDDPYTIAVAREESMKLLPLFVRYAHVFSTKALCPLLVMTTMNEYLFEINKRNTSTALARIMFFMIFGIIFSSISGARGPGAYIGVSMFAFFLFRNQIVLSAKFLKVSILLLICILSIPIIIDYLRSDTKDMIMTTNTIFRRIFFVPLQAGIYNVYFAEIYGYWGIGAVTSLAKLVGVDSISVANEVYRLVYPSSISTGLINASFMLTYYSYFGLISFPLCIVLVLLLDAIPWFTSKYIDPRLQCYSAAIYTASLIALRSIDYTTYFISSGVIFSLATLFVLSKIK